MGGKNISKLHRDELNAKLDEVADFLDRCEASLEQQEAINRIYDVKRSLRGKRYGLRFEEHREKVDDLLDGSVPVLIEDESLKVTGGGEQNFLIEGDNLVALDLLCRTHAGGIDLIYIDPPYNLGGKDFRYDDDYVDKNDSFRHSKWLSFMDRRLRKAKRLLSSKGSIFISINDVEQAPLKMLCDDVFGHECFQGCICWQKTYSPKNDKHGLPAECEYIYVYSKQPNWMPKRLERTDEMDARYGSPDGDPAAWKSGDASAPGASTHHGMVYAIQHPITGAMLYPPNGRHWTFGQTLMMDILKEWADYKLEDLGDDAKRAEICGCGVGKIKDGTRALVLCDTSAEAFERARRRYDEGVWPQLYFTSGGTGGIACKRYLDEVDDRLPTNYWPYSEVGHTDGAKKELKRIFGGKAPFETPKPTKLIERILDIASDDDSIILDFFAGSATTAHAVLKHNEERSGRRKFILCTNNENGICREVAYERVRRVIEGYSFTGKTERVVFEREMTSKLISDPVKMAEVAESAVKTRDDAKARYGKASVKVEGNYVRVVAEERHNGAVGPTPGSLKYMRVGYIPFDEDRVYEISDEAMLHVRELVELENGIDFSTSTAAAIAFTDDELDAIVENLPADCETVYIGRDVLVSSKAAQVFCDRGVKLNVIPEYYYHELGD